MNLTATLNTFGELLGHRFERGVFTTEDSIRYTFFASLLRHGVECHDVILEHRHPTISRAQVDTWIPGFGSGGLAVEFKYDREIPSGGNGPRTQKAGKLFHDLYRLGLMDRKAQRVLVYVAGQEMSGYFSNPSNSLQDFYSLGPSNNLSINAAYMAKRPKTFLDAAAETPNVAVTALYARNLPSQHTLRIYEVSNVTG